MNNLKLKAIFIHHSTGANFIKEGDLRKKLKKFIPEIEFFDQGYNRVGLYKLRSLYNPNVYGFRNSYGEEMQETIFIPNNNTNPDGLCELFSQEVDNHSDNALSKILKYDIIIFKSCFPVTAIKTEEQLQNYQKYYFKIRDVISSYPSKTFVLLTPPPLRASQTNSIWAKRARRFANWMKSYEYKYNLANLYVFDLFDLLASKENVLAKDYERVLFFDSHPNTKANILIADELIKFLLIIINEVYTNKK